MKKLKFLLVLLISIFAFNISVFAASGSLSVSSTNVYVGDKFTVSAKISSAAAWNVHVTASGPVSGCSINQADATADAMDTNKTFNATCTATGTGTISIVLSGDVTSASDGNAVNISGSKSVNVVAKPTTNPTTNPPVTTNKNDKTTTKKNDDNKSRNNNIKELSVDGYNLIKVDENNYTLYVTDDVNSINIKAIAEDQKAKVTGSGTHNLNKGDNNIEVIITSESGVQRKINIKVIRKSEYSIQDLETALNNDNINDINVTINSDTLITKEKLEKIKDSKKTVNFNYYDNNKKLIYSWILEGSKIKNTEELLTTISFDSENKKDILRLSNYADGLFVNIKQDNLINGSKIKLYVGNKYNDEDLLNIYAYNKDKDNLSLISKKVNSKNRYIEFYVTDSSDYLITMSTVASQNELIENNKNISSNVLYLLLGFIGLLIITIIIICIVQKKKHKKKDEEIEETITLEI